MAGDESRRMAPGGRHCWPVVLFVVGLLLAPASETLAQDGTEHSYADPETGWSITWDPVLWKEPGPFIGGAPNHDLALATTTNKSLLYFRAAGYGGDPATCLRDKQVFIATGFPTPDLVLLPDVGTPVAGDEEGRAIAAFRQRLGSGGAVIWAFDCRTLVPGEAVLMIVHTVDERFYETEADLVAQLLTGLRLPQAATGSKDDATPMAGAGAFASSSALAD